MCIKHAKIYFKDFDLNLALTWRGKHTDFIFIHEENEAQKSKDTWPRSHSTTATQIQVFWFQVMLIDS